MCGRDDVLPVRHRNRALKKTIVMMRTHDWWQLFRLSGRIEFYNAYRALGEEENGQKGQGDSDKGGAV